jgi:hypothetical protein
MPCRFHLRQYSVRICHEWELADRAAVAFGAHLRDAARAASSVNKYIQVLKALDRWLTKKGYRPASALSVESETLGRRQGTHRDRGLVPIRLEADQDYQISSLVVSKPGTARPTHALSF